MQALHKLLWGLWILLPRPADIEDSIPKLSRNLWCLMTCCAPIRVEAERQPIIRTCWRCSVWCTAAKELHSLLWTIPRKSTVCDHKSTLPPDSSENKLLDVRQQLCCRLTKEQKWQLLFDRNWASLAPRSKTKWLVYLRKWKVICCLPVVSRRPRFARLKCCLTNRNG